MASLQTSGFLFSSSSSSSTDISSKRSIKAAISVPKLQKIRLPIQKSRNLVEELIFKDSFTSTIPAEKNVITRTKPEENSPSTSKSRAKLYAILEAVADRVEMHKNIGEQRDNWNKLLLNSINMITLTATTMAGVATAGGVAGGSILALQLSSTLLFTAATGMLVIMNKIQPSQLAEEQRNATRLFKQLYNEIQTIIDFNDPTEMDVKDAMNKVLALDKAYPLPLLGKMIEKFPEDFEPAVWWTKSNNDLQRKGKKSKELEMEMREVIEVIKRKDSEDYMRLGNVALKINKILAISGPVLTGIAAAGSALSSHGSWLGMVGVAAGALASTVNTFEHGGQVGMVVEMYRNGAGFFKLLEESIESDLERNEDGEMVEMKVALKLGRSLSELQNLAKKSISSSLEGIEIDEFASKLF